MTEHPGGNLVMVLCLIYAKYSKLKGFELIYD